MRAIATGMTTIAVLVFGSGGALASRGQIPDYLRFPAATVKQLKKDRSARVAAGSNRPVFIKVGDSNTATHLALYGLGCYRYKPKGLRSSLIKVVRRYRRTSLASGRLDVPGASCRNGNPDNSFSRISLASRGGAYFSYALEPCETYGLPCAGSILVCEIEATGPRYAFIQFGTNEALQAPEGDMSAGQLEEMRAQISEIVRACRSYRVTPVILTAPVALDGGNWTPGVPGRVVAINQMIRQTAKASRAPLIDLWLAQSEVIGPRFNYGLDKGGIHLSSSPNTDPWRGTVNLSILNRRRYGMNLRSYLILSALEKLDSIKPRRGGRPQRHSAQ